MTPAAYNAEHAKSHGILPADIGASSWADLAGIKRWQVARRLDADGFFGPASLRAYRAEHPAPAPSLVTGIDVSGNNGAFKADPSPFAKVKAAGHAFVYVKASEDTGYAFSRLSAWREAARSSGLLVGTYHFAQPGHEAGDAEREAAHFRAVAGPHLAGDLVPVLDLELNKSALSPAELVRWALAFLTEAQRLFGVRPMVYTYSAFWAGPLARTQALSLYPAWVANYPSRPPTPATPFPTFGAWTPSIWQYTQRGTIPGMPGHVDVNRVAGSIDELRAP